MIANFSSTSFSFPSPPTHNLECRNLLAGSSVSTVRARFSRRLRLGSNLSRQSSSSSSDPGSDSLKLGLALAGELRIGAARRLRVWLERKEGLVSGEAEAEEVVGMRRAAAVVVLEEEEGCGEEVRGGAGEARALVLVDDGPAFFCGVGSTACLTLRTSVLTLNLDFWLNMLIFVCGYAAANSRHVKYAGLMLGCTVLSMHGGIGSVGEDALMGGAAT